jgi:predicted transcriptional regulator
MVKRSLLDITTMSSIRKELLLYLEAGPRSLTEIREYMDITSPEVSPRLKELVEHGLVSVEDKRYMLAPMGKVLVSHLRPFVRTIDLFEKYPEFWESHDLSGIPDVMLGRIHELSHCQYIEDTPENIQLTKGEFENIVLNSKFIYGVSNVFDESMPGLFLKVFRKKIPVSVIFSGPVMGIINKKFVEMFLKYSRHDNIDVYLMAEEMKTSFILTDTHLYLSLFYKSGRHDLQSNLVGTDPEALKWGKDLFEHYKALSVKVN